MNKEFKGLGVAIVTPFRADGSIDFSALERLVNYQINNGVNFLVALGTTSETATLSDDEYFAVINFISEINQQRVPLVVGAGGNNTNALLDHVHNIKQIGASGILSVTPYYNKPNQNGLFEHFKAIANNTNLPIILYNVPSRTGVNLSAETTVKLAKQFKNIVAVKEASGNLIQAMQIVKHKPNDFTLISGDDALTLPLISIGAEGVISVVGNAYPKQFSDMVNIALNNDVIKAQSIHYQLIDMINVLFEEGNPAGIKALLNHLGLIDNYLRLPLIPVSEKLNDKIKNIANNIS